jgi:hypothetical protein
MTKFQSALTQYQAAIASYPDKVAVANRLFSQVAGWVSHSGFLWISFRY